MAGLAAFFKILYRIMVDGQSNKKQENFQFVQQGSLQISVNDNLSKDLEKYDILGGFLLLLVYPIVIVPFQVYAS